MTTPDLDMRALNSATKYPSIPTHHGLNPKNGSLIETEATAYPAGSHVVATEKVDGTNARLILVGTDWFIGSREELLTAKGDRVSNPALGIVASLARTAADAARRNADDSDVVVTLYVELYGLRSLPAWKAYGDGTTAGWRLFDISKTPITQLGEDIDRIASWRHHGGQHFLSEKELDEHGTHFGLELTPRVGVLAASDLPTAIAGMRELLVHLVPATRVALTDAVAAKLPEGVVFRSDDRSVITKARFEDYDRTLKRRANGR